MNKDYSSYFRIEENGSIYFTKSWDNDSFKDLEKELPIMLEQAHNEQRKFIRQSNRSK